MKKIICMKEEKLQLYIRAKRLIKKAFLINYSIPKGYGTRSSEYQKFYDQKENLIRKAVDLIRDNGLSIKYGHLLSRGNEGWLERITYFEFEGNQYSFHGICKFTKKFKGEWIGRRNTPEVALHKRRKGNITYAGLRNCYDAKYLAKRLS